MSVESVPPASITPSPKYSEGKSETESIEQWCHYIIDGIKLLEQKA